mmetsp:Transcript_75973/g.176242  ORF Transcript_75973/g.176242 Transcript_75973/m.176242 type:complete len:95 (+) Transcript_75973:655-939(+)
MTLSLDCNFFASTAQDADVAPDSAPTTQVNGASAAGGCKRSSDGDAGGAGGTAALAKAGGNTAGALGNQLGGLPSAPEWEMQTLAVQPEGTGTY